MTVPVAIVATLPSMDVDDESTISPSGMGALEISRLTGGMAQGDEAAFCEFHRIYFPRLLRYLFVVTRGNEDDARDALQETFIRVARHIRVFETEDTFWSWLTLLARSAATDGGRKTARYWRMLTRYACFWQAEPEHENPLPSLIFEKHLDAAIETLEKTDRALIERKYFHGESVRELAAQFPLGEKAIESRLARARYHLRRELSKRLRDEKEN